MCRFESDRRYSKKLDKGKSHEETAALSRFSLRHMLRLIQAFKLAGLDGLILGRSCGRWRILTRLAVAEKIVCLLRTPPRPGRHTGQR